MPLKWRADVADYGAQGKRDFPNKYGDNGYAYWGGLVKAATAPSAATWRPSSPLKASEDSDFVLALDVLANPANALGIPVSNPHDGVMNVLYLDGRVVITKQWVNDNPLRRPELMEHR